MSKANDKRLYRNSKQLFFMQASSSKEREKSANTHDEIIISKRQQQQKFKTTAAFRDFSVFPSKFEFLANYKKDRDTSTV